MPTTSNGMYYEERGEGGDTIVLLPGFGCSLACWNEFAPLIDGYRAILFDLPGHAGSVKSRADGVLAHMAEDVFAACREIGLDGFVVAGMSLGGAIAVRIALDQPDSVYAVAGLMPWNAGGTAPGTAEDPKFFHDAFGDTEMMKVGVVGISHQPEKTTDLLVTMPTVTERMWKGWLGGGVYTSMAEELPQMRVPTLYVVGGKDHVVNLAAQVEDIRRIPGGRLVMIADGGHLDLYEEPGRLAVEVSDFVRRHARVRA